MKNILISLIVFVGLVVAASPSDAAGIYHCYGRTDSLVRANANVQPGDIVYVEPGTYMAPIKPARGGTSGARITYLGAKSNPTGAVVAGVLNVSTDDHINDSLYCSYVTVKWVASTGGGIGPNFYLWAFPPYSPLYWRCVRNDSLVKITSFAGSGLSCVSRYSVYDSITVTCVNTDALSLRMDASDGQANGSFGDASDSRFLRPAGNTIKNSTFNSTVGSGSGERHGVVTFKTAYNTIWNNTFNVTYNGGSVYYFLNYSYFSYYNVFQGNTYNLVMNGAATAGGNMKLLGYRDSTGHCRWVKNTFNVTGPIGIDVGLSQSGKYPGTTSDNCFDGNVFKIQTAAGNGLNAQNGLRSDTLQNNIVRVGAGGPAFSLASDGELRNTVIRHNTFYTNAGLAISIDPAVAGATSRFVSNIAYVRNGTINGIVAKVPTFLGLDSAGVFYSFGAGNPANAIQRGATLGAPGSSAPYGDATMSLWGDPAFVDIAQATFDPHLKTGSVGLTATLHDGYAGALADTTVHGPRTWAVETDSALTVAMAGATPGDVVQFRAGSFSASRFAPASSGAFPYGRIRIVGNAAHPESVVVVGNTTIAATGLSITGITFRGPTVISPCATDSITYCVFTSPNPLALSLPSGMTGTVFRSNTVYCVGLVGMAISGAVPASSEIRGNAFVARPWPGTCYSDGFSRGGSLLAFAAQPFNSDSNFFASSSPVRMAGLVSGGGCWTLTDWYSASGNDAHSRSASFSGSTFMDGRSSVLDLRPSAHSPLYNSAAPGGHYGALAKP